MTPVRVGLLVNPVAGLGGRVGLKGSDGPATQRQALALGAVPRAGARARAALAELRSRGAGFTLLAAGGPMGVGEGDVVYAPAGPATSPADTAAAVRALVHAGADLLLFAGGDGTARDIHDALADDSCGVPVLGIPTGVKMHSAVFAVNPRAAGEVAAAYANAAHMDVRPAEVMDRDEAALRAGHLTTTLHGWLPSPHVPLRVQQRKTGTSPVTPDAVGGIAAELTARLTALWGAPLPTPPAPQTPEGLDFAPSPPDFTSAPTAARPPNQALPQPPAGRCPQAIEDAGGWGPGPQFREGAGWGKEEPLLILGPGTTTQAVAAALGADVSPTGVNALALHGRTAHVVAPDATADNLLRLAQARETLIAISPIGGQGFLLGRGNQQLTPELIHTVSPHRLTVICTEAKLAALQGRPLLLDTGDDALDAGLTGYREVLTGHRKTTMYRLTS